MGKPVEAPEIFNNPDPSILELGQEFKSVDIPTTLDGAYNGNGQFKVPDGMVFRLKGVDKRGRREHGIGQAYKIVETDSSGN